MCEWFGWIAFYLLGLGVGAYIGLTSPKRPPPTAAPATPCTAMHRQLIVIPRVDSHGQMVSTPIVVDVCDKANVAYVEVK